VHIIEYHVRYIDAHLSLRHEFVEVEMLPPAISHATAERLLD